MERRLRARRLAEGLTQGELAERAGVSRQLVAAVEAGRNTPAVDAALRLARALGATVEELFSTPPPGIVPALGDRLRDGVPLRVGRVGERLVAAELPDHGAAAAGWATPDGVLEGGRLRLFPGAGTDGLVLAGCDPALGMAEALLRERGPSGLIALSAPTDTASRALARGRVHAAVVHGPAERLPAPPVDVIRLHLATWEVGLAVPAGVRARNARSVLTAGLPVVQRDPAAASQQALQRVLDELGLPGPEGPRASGHVPAARLAATLGVAALTTEAAARAFGLRFVGLERHTVQVWVAQGWAGHPVTERLGNLLAGRAFTERVAALGGYDLTGCGTLIAA